MNKSMFLIMMLTIYLIWFLVREYIKNMKMQKQFREDMIELTKFIVESKYQILLNDIKNLEMFHQKGGEYIIPDEVMNRIMGEIEVLEGKDEN